MDFTTAKATVPILGSITGESSRGQSRYHPYFDTGALENFMSTRSEAERQTADDAFKSRFGKSLEQVARNNLHGAELTRALSAINRKDGDIVSPRAAEVKALLTGGERGFAVEKNLRDIFATSTSEDLAKIAAFYGTQQENEGPGKKHQSAAKPTDLYEAVHNSNLSDKTKAALNILKNGADRRTIDDSIKLAELGLAHKDMDLFALGMSTPQARKKFLDNAGETKILFAFGSGEKRLSYHQMPKESAGSKRALDLARTGHTSAAAEVDDQTWHFPGMHFTLNPGAVGFALSRLTPDERSAYGLGKSLSEHPERRSEGKTEAEKNSAKSYYDRLHSALSAVGNSTDMIKWEDKIANQNGSIVGQLAFHRGLIYNDGTEEIRKDIAGMTRQQWQDAREHPERREELSKMLKSLGQHGKSYISLMDTYDAMLKPGTTSENDEKTWKKAQDAGKNPLLHDLKDAQSFGGGGAVKIFESISEMSNGDQARLRKDDHFRGQVAKITTQTVSNPEQARAIDRLRDQIMRGEKPKPDLAARIAFESDPAKAIRDIQSAFKKDTDLRKRLAEPIPEADKHLAQDFKTSLNRLLPSSYLFGTKGTGALTDQLLKDGRLPLEKIAPFSRASLSSGRLGNDLLALAQDALNATPEERARLLSYKPEDRAYQNQVLAGLTAPERAVALAVVRQGKIQPEDKIRASLVGLSVSSSPLKALKELVGEDAKEEVGDEKENDDDNISDSKPDASKAKTNLLEAKANYAQKYGRDLETDLLRSTYDEDRDKVKTLLSHQLDLEEQADLTRKDAVQSRSGFGAGAVDLFSGTGKQTDETLRQLSAQFADLRNFKLKETPPAAQVAVFQDRLKSLQTAVENNRDAKSTVGETASDILIGAVGVGSVLSSGGVTLPVVASVMSTSALLKLGANSIMRHDSYKGRDALVGAAGGLGSMLGPGEIATTAFFKLGAQPAEDAVGKIVAQESFKKLFLHHADYTSASEALTGQTSQLAREALANNNDISAAEVKAAVRKALAPTLPAHVQDDTIANVSKAISENLNADLQAKGSVRRLAISQGLSFGAVSSATVIQRLSEDGMLGKSPTEISRNLSSDMQSAIEYSLALDGLGFAGGALAKLAAKARAEHRAIDTSLQHSSKIQEDEHSRGLPPGAISMLVNTLPDPPEDDGKKDDDDDDEDKNKRKK